MTVSATYFCVDDVLLHCGRISVVWGTEQSSSGMYVPDPHRPATETGHKQPATDNRPWATGVSL